MSLNSKQNSLYKLATI